MYVTIQCALPKMLASTGPAARHHQHGVDRVVDQGLPQPLRLRRVEGRGHRADQGGRRRLRRQGHPLQRDRARAPSTRRRCTSASTRSPDPVEARKISSRGSRWAGSASRRRSRRWSSSSRPTNRRSSPATSTPVDGGMTDLRPRPPAARLARHSHRRTHETRTLRPRRQGKARPHRRRRQAARPVAQGQGHRPRRRSRRRSSRSSRSSTSSACRWSRASRASGPASAGVVKFVAIGLNYADHAAETGMPIPEHPIVFFKSTTCIVGPNDNVMIPKDSKKTDWEVELGVVIGRTRALRRREGRAEVRRRLLPRSTTSPSASSS